MVVRLLKPVVRRRSSPLLRPGLLIYRAGAVQKGWVRGQFLRTMGTATGVVAIGPAGKYGQN